MSTSVAYAHRRARIETYFDRTAASKWAAMTSDAPLGRIRQKVREGREHMADLLASYLPEDLRGRRVLDAGCGTGALAIRLAARGADVVAIDLSPTLIGLARARLPGDLPGTIEFRSGDMLDPSLGSFDHLLSMDCLIHYTRDDTIGALAALSARISTSMVFTYAPRTPLLALMHAAGRLFPRDDRSPAIEPVSARAFETALSEAPALEKWRLVRTARVAQPFYVSQAVELVRS